MVQIYCVRNGRISQDYTRVDSLNLCLCLNYQPPNMDE